MSDQSKWKVELLLARMNVRSYLLKYCSLSAGLEDFLVVHHTHLK
mgnify:CR=1 FL=1